MHATPILSDHQDASPHLLAQGMRAASSPAGGATLQCELTNCAPVWGHLSANPPAQEQRSSSPDHRQAPRDGKLYKCLMAKIIRQVFAGKGYWSLTPSALVPEPRNEFRRSCSSVLSPLPIRTLSNRREFDCGSSSLPGPISAAL